MAERKQDLLIDNLAEISTPVGTSYRRGAEQARVQRTRGDGSGGMAVLCRGERIEFAGTAEMLQKRFGAADTLSKAHRLDAKGGTLVPGFVDSHTHLPWSGSRETEYAARLAGKSYQEIAAAGGGILSTVAATRAASEEELAQNTSLRLGRLLTNGTTTAEVKSGYGLTLEDELKQLRAVRQAARLSPVDVVPTLMAAHEFPPEYREDRDGYVDLVCNVIIPQAAEAGLAHFCDVFCERGVYDVEQARRVLESGRGHGLVPRLHADEFVDSGAAELAGELGAATADHLVAVSEAGIEALAGGGVAAVLLPGVSFFLMKDDYAPARRLVEAGVPVVLATDCNPGSSHTESLPMIVWLAIFKMGLSIEECLTAITLNPACALGLGTDIGSIEAGKQADLVILDAPNLDHLGYRFGTNPVHAVVKAGRVVKGS